MGIPGNTRRRYDAGDGFVYLLSDEDMTGTFYDGSVDLVITFHPDNPLLYDLP